MTQMFITTAEYVPALAAAYNQHKPSVLLLDTKHREQLSLGSWVASGSRACLTISGLDCVVCNLIM